jgi:SAM-dependent methyltransferase
VSYDYSIYYSHYHDDSEAHAEAMAASLVELLKNDVPADRSAKILDVGCGYGFALRALRSLGFSALEGLESSPQQSERCRAAGFPVEVAEDSVAWLGAHAGKFDCVLLLDVIEHVPVALQIDFVRAIHQCLAPGGRLIVTTPNANAILAARWRYNDHTHHSSFTERSLHFVLKNAAFDPISIDASKGIGRFPRRLWRRSAWPMARKWIVRWCWLQVFKAEVPWEDIGQISFELNLKAVAHKP